MHYKCQRRQTYISCIVAPWGVHDCDVLVVVNFLQLVVFWAQSHFHFFAVHVALCCHYQLFVLALVVLATLVEVSLLFTLRKVIQGFVGGFTVLTQELVLINELVIAEF